MEILRNIDNSVKLIKTIALIAIICSFSFSIYIYTYSMNQIENAREKVYLLSKGNALELIRGRNMKENVLAEVRNHITMFHEYFFNLDPDIKDIKTKVNKSLNLIDESGKLLESQRTESMYYHKMIEGSISSRVYIDSIFITEADEKYICKIYAKQKLERSSKVTMKYLTSECRVRQTNRTESNPHGLIIENFIITNNTTINEYDKI